MQKEKRLPQSGKEGFLYGAIIATLTVLFMATFNGIYFAGEFNVDVVISILKLVPIIWIIVIGHRTYHFRTHSRSINS